MTFVGRPNPGRGAAHGGGTSARLARAAGRLSVLALLLTAAALCAQDKPGRIPKANKPKQYDEPRPGPKMAKARTFIQAEKAQKDYQVNGKGLTVAVLDTGLNTAHNDFQGRVLVQRNYTSDNSGNENDATDGNGHGTHVTGIIAANNLTHAGIAPGVKIIPLKVWGNDSSAGFAIIEQALQWVLDNHKARTITVVNLSLGDENNFAADDGFAAHGVRTKIKQLRDAKIAVVTAAGNAYFSFSPKSKSAAQGMCFPAILRETISVSAVYGDVHNEQEYRDGAKITSATPDQICAFAQRLHETASASARTDIFAPGAPVTSTGILTSNGQSDQEHGTSQAAPMVAGVILLMQEYCLREMKELPSVDDLEKWLRDGAVSIDDAAGDFDNVAHTKLKFPRLDALGALAAVKKAVDQRRKP